MSLATNTQCSYASTTGTKAGVFQDLPLINRFNRLTIIEMENSDKQIANELVYRWCRILTRNWKNLNETQVMIVDMIASINPIRLATVLKRESGRMKLINIARQCKINSTFVTLSSNIKRDFLTGAPKLFVIYHDEFFVLKTLKLLEGFLKSNKSQVLLLVPKLDRQERDYLGVIQANQLLRVDFCISRKDIGPAPPETTNESYQTYLNQVLFQRHSVDKSLPDKVYGELREDGLHLHNSTHKPTTKTTTGMEVPDGIDPATKRFKMESNLV